MAITLLATEISGLAEPSYNSGAANKKYVDNNAGGTSYWSSQTNASLGSVYYDAGEVIIAPSGTDYGDYKLQVSGSTFLSGTTTFIGNQISGLTQPTYNSGIANKKYVDNISGNLSTAVGLNTTHRQDNTQAHTDYLLNNADDTTTGIITAAGFKTTSHVSSQLISGSWITPLHAVRPVAAAGNLGQIIRVSGSAALGGTWIYMCVTNSGGSPEWIQIGMST